MQQPAVHNIYSSEKTLKQVDNLLNNLFLRSESFIGMHSDISFYRKCFQFNPISKIKSNISPEKWVSNDPPLNPAFEMNVSQHSCQRV